MFAKTYGATTLGIDGRIIDVEVDVSPGLPGFELVGLLDMLVKESKERVRTAIRNSGIPRPGEETLAHYGVLFLDELPEFSKRTLEVLREPIEDRRITVSHANATLTFPSSIILVAAMNKVTSITIQCNDEREEA